MKRKFLPIPIAFGWYLSVNRHGWLLMKFCNYLNWRQYTRAFSFRIIIKYQQKIKVHLGWLRLNNFWQKKRRGYVAALCTYSLHTDVENDDDDHNNPWGLIFANANNWKQRLEWIYYSTHIHNTHIVIPEEFSICEPLLWKVYYIDIIQLIGFKDAVHSIYFSNYYSPYY